jgi:hypothetical protein
MNKDTVAVTTADGSECFNPNSTAGDILQLLAPGGGALRSTTNGRLYVGSNLVPAGSYTLVFAPSPPPAGAYSWYKITAVYGRQAHAWDLHGTSITLERGVLASACRLDLGVLVVPEVVTRLPTAYVTEYLLVQSLVASQAG